MQIFYSIALFLLIGANSMVWGEERVAETLDNVDFIVENLKDEEGKMYGESYFALNRNNYPMRISMEITQAKNVETKIAPYTIVMEPSARVPLGTVVKINPEEDAVWNYEWLIEPDLHDLNVEKLEMCSEFL